MYESPLHCLTALADHNLSALGILWNDVCERYARCKRSLVASCKCPGLFGFTVVLSVCVGSGVTFLTCRSRCAVQIVKPDFWEPLFVSLLRTGTVESNCKSWVQVAKSGTTSGNWKGVHAKQQYNGAQAAYSLDACANGEKFCVYETVHVRIAAVSNALTEFGCFRRQCIVATTRIPLDRIGNQTAWTKTDCTASRLAAGAISWCVLRLAGVESAKTESRWCPVM